LARFGTPAGILSASGSELLEVDGVGPKLSSAIILARNSEDAERELADCGELGVRLLIRGAPQYPRMLAETCDAPSLLYCRGDLLPADELAVAIVGSRQCTLYGRQQAERFASTLARAGITIISGLARGIDAAAHRGALSAGGRTIAVSATGLNELYPPEHAELADEISRNGAVVSESPLNRGPSRGIFPQRNRIISGLSLGVVIIEANRKSGALHTARHANEQGREVFALPGRVDCLASQGCLDLLRDGVTLLRSPDDVLETLGPLMQPVKRADGDVVHVPRELNLSDQERTILNLVTSDPMHVDQVLAGAGIETSRVLATLTILEMKRLVRRQPGGYLVRAY
ncbi:MAG: DNA-protecting protein DprA, partial [Planctomycetaceae bacterium]|nr:DNA-protecting protein DprA [Planctomycetaceae bacterium]